MITRDRMLKVVVVGAICLFILGFVENEMDDPIIITASMHHLRNHGDREWNQFPEHAEDTCLELSFVAERNATARTLRLRQEDVKQWWSVALNGDQLGRLTRDENHMVVYFSVPSHSLIDGRNELTIFQDPPAIGIDDIRVGEIVLETDSLESELNQATIEIHVVEKNSRQLLPARITILDESGGLQTTSAESNLQLAVRPGTIFTSSGMARFGVPSGSYTIYAGRGFEYSLDHQPIQVSKGDLIAHWLEIEREVPTDGYVASDTHVHTLTHSGHGDASIEERMITIAAEGIELPIATDHNKHIDYLPVAKELDLLKHFTPIIGNEVTTAIGHFNVFPALEEVPVPDFSLTDWGSILNGIYRTPDVKVAILNHPRDLHSGTIPFGPKLFNAVVAENTRDWPMLFNAVEVINSGATQSDILLLFRDWMALLNRGYDITPVGSSDSHDVARHFVGQGRTYIRCEDSAPGHIDVDAAVNSFLQGSVMVSYGLLVDMTVAGKYRSGELARISDDMIKLDLKVMGPTWTSADSLLLFSNGQLVRSMKLPPSRPDEFPKGIKWQGQWDLPRPQHDVHLVAIALGPGVDGLYWKTAKPYQPSSPDWTAKVAGACGAIWLDGDGDGQKSSAYAYAKPIYAQSEGDFHRLIDLLREYDQAVADQVAGLYQSRDRKISQTEREMLREHASKSTVAGFESYLEAWQENQQAK